MHVPLRARTLSLSVTGELSLSLPMAKQRGGSLCLPLLLWITRATSSSAPWGTLEYAMANGASKYDLHKYGKYGAAERDFCATAALVTYAPDALQLEAMDDDRKPAPIYYL